MAFTKTKKFIQIMENEIQKLSDRIWKVFNIKMKP